MVAEFLKWLQGVGIGAVAVLAQYLGGVTVANVSNVLEIIAVAVIARIVGFLVSKLPVPAA